MIFDTKLPLRTHTGNTIPTRGRFKFIKGKVGLLNVYSTIHRLHFDRLNGENTHSRKLILH